MCNNEKKNDAEDVDVRVFDESIELASNAMLRHRIDLFDQWDFEENDKLGLDVYKITISNGKSPNWQCTIDSRHKWKSRVADRATQGCPYCSNHRIMVGYNSMWDTNKKLASMLMNPDDGYKYMQTSGEKVDWECPECEEFIKNKQIAFVKNRGLFCPNCSDGKSYPEKFMYYVLKELELEFEWEKVFLWSDEKRYDFYVEYNNHKILIECHGKQHYEESPRGRSLQEEQENDRYKYEMAIKNGIDEYIVIDCRESSLSFIKKSIINSNVFEIFENQGIINWDKVAILSEKSLVLEVNEMWNSGNKNIKDIAENTKLHVWTVANYLKTGMNNGWNDYCPNKARLNGSKSRMVKVVQIDKSSKSTTYESAREAYLATDIDSSSITAVCKGRRKTAGGYKWMYKEDYEEMLTKKLA